MKNFALSLLLFFSLSSYSQLDAWFNYEDADYIRYHYAVIVLDSVGSPLVQKSYMIVDTSLIYLAVDTVRIESLYQYSFGKPYSIVWSDSTGALRKSSIDSLSISWDQITDTPVVAPLPSILSSGSRNFNQAYQISATEVSTISTSVDIACNLSLSGGQAGNVQLQISANGSSGWQTVAQLTASNTGTLTIGLNTTQISGGQLVFDGLPAGYYWRLLTTNTTGTPTYTFNGGFEKTY